jgi:hypothetical protein
MVGAPVGRYPSTMRFLNLAPLMIVSTWAGCLVPSFTAVDGPNPPPFERISRVVVTPIGEEQRRVEDLSAEDLRKIFGRDGWTKNRNTLRPLYQVILYEGDASVAMYWLGAYSYPPRLPCLWLCTGWWLAPVLPDGQVDASRVKSFAATTDLLEITKLPIP